MESGLFTLPLSNVFGAMVALSPSAGLLTESSVRMRRVGEQDLFGARGWSRMPVGGALDNLAHAGKPERGGLKTALTPSE